MWQTDTQGVGAANFRCESLRDLERSAGSCKSWVHSWREDEAGGSCGLEGHLLRNLDKSFQREEKKEENRERRKGKPF